MAKLNEQELIACIRNNDKQGFSYLYKNYSAALLMVIQKIVPDNHTAEDILQESFVSVWANIHQFDASKGCLYTWMRNIAKNKAIDLTRSAVSNMKRRTDRQEDKIHEYALNAEQKIDHIGIAARVNMLSYQHQLLIRLVYYKGHTIEEISRLMDVPLGTIKSRMRRALGLLRADFQYNIS